MTPGPSERLSQSLADRYRLEREIGQGGMATVYLAEDLKHGRKVAIKVLRPELAAIIGAERFVREIRTIAALQHPHILGLIDSGAVDGTAYYVMPFVEGESLRDRLNRDKQLPIPDAVRIGTEVAGALDYAHRHGVIHRDIKPENILLHDGQALVADFGIALAASSAGTRMTETGMSLGTPHYMSPEQAMGEREITARSDVYALGCITYEMLTGEPPFTGTTAQAIVARVLTETPRPMAAQRRTIPPHVEAAVLRALEKLPADRFGSAAEFATALNTPGAMRAAAIRSRPGFDWRTALALGVVIGAGAAWFATRRADAGSHPGGADRRQLTFNGRSFHPAISPDGTFIAYVDEACKAFDVDPCQATLTVQEVGSTRAVPVLSGAPRLGSPRWSHDGTTLVVDGQLDSLRSGLFAVPRLGGAARLLGGPGAFDTHPSGDTVVAIRERPGQHALAVFISLASGAVTDSVALTIDAVRDVSWAPNGRFLAATGADNRLIVLGRDGKSTGASSSVARAAVRWSLRGDAVLQFQTGAGKEDELVRIPVDGAGRVSGPGQVVMARVPTLYLGEFDLARRTGQMILLTGDAIADIWSVDLTPGHIAAMQRTRGTAWYGPPSVSADGKSIYYFRGDALGDNVYALSLADGTEDALTAERRPGASWITASADGRRLVFGRAGDKGRLLEWLEFPSRKATTQETSGRVERVWPLPSGGLVDRSPDGRSLLVSDSAGGAWRAISLPDSLKLLSYAPSPDGTSIAFVASGPDQSAIFGTVAVSGGEVHLLSRFAHEPGTPALTWDRDGTLYMARWLPADQLPSVWTVAPATGEATRFVTLPARCNPGSVSIAMAQHLAVCAVEDYRGDAWIIDGVGGKP